MKQFELVMNTVAIDLALTTLFGNEARDKAKAAYDNITAALNSSFALGAASRDQHLTELKEEFEKALVQQSDEAVATIKAAERIGFDKGHAQAMFAQAAEKLNAEAAAVDKCLAPVETKVNDSETAFLRNAVSALN